MRTLKNESVDCIITDPPYGIDYQSASRRFPKIANDSSPFIWWIYDAFRVLKSPGCMAVFTRWDVEDAFRRSLEIAGFRIKSQVIWDKQIHGMGDLKGAFAPVMKTLSSQQRANMRSQASGLQA